MRVVLRVAVAAAPFLAGVIGPHAVSVQGVHVRVDGVTVTLFAAGVLAIAAGVVCLRLMDDRRDIPLRTDMVSAIRRRDPELGRGTRAGYFLALEGGEGAGKSTLARRIAEDLRARGYEVVLTFEPGDTSLGARIRQVLLDPQSAGMTPRTEAMLYA